MLQDGGGSSTLWVDGRIRNTPSGKVGTDPAKALRPVANGYMIALVLPPRKSDAFQAGRKVTLKSDAQLRLGPGSFYGVLGKLPAGQKVSINPHPTNGILAKGAYWWCCKSGETEGWLSMEQLSAE